MEEIVGGVIEKVETEWDYVKVYVRKGKKQYLLHVNGNTGVNVSLYDKDKESWMWS